MTVTIGQTGGRPSFALPPGGQMFSKSRTDAASPKAAQTSAKSSSSKAAVARLSNLPPLENTPLGKLGGAFGAKTGSPNGISTMSMGSPKTAMTFREPSKLPRKSPTKSFDSPLMNAGTMTGGGTVVTFELKGGSKDRAFEVLDKLQIV